MSKLMQNLVVLMEPSEHADDASLKGGNMILNRFCIDEEAGFELSGVHYLKESSFEIKYGANPGKNLWDYKTVGQTENWEPLKNIYEKPWETPREKRKAKGKENSFFRSYFTVFL